MQAEMIAWQSDYHHAEGEYQRMNEELLQEVPLASQAESRPESVNPPAVSFPPVFNTQFTVPVVSSSPQSIGQASGQAMDAEIQAKWASLSALRKSYPGAPPPANWVPQGVNVSTSAVQSSQATIPQFFNFIGSNAGNVLVTTGAPIMPFAISQIKEKSPPSSVPEPPSKSGWVWSELAQKWLKTPELIEKERAARLHEIVEEETQRSITEECTQNSGTTISPSEAARIKAEVQGVMK